MVFSKATVEHNIWSLELDDSGRVVGPAVRAFDSSQSELTPTFSPDGSRVALGSTRSGYHEIWVCQSDGSNCGQLTSTRDYAGTPTWSPDAKWIAYDDVVGILIISSEGGKPRALISGIAPKWSRDGWIYFGRGASLYRIRPDGDHLEQIATGAGAPVSESPDNSWIYGNSVTDSGGTLRRIPAAGGRPFPLLFQVAGRNFEVLENGIFYFTPNTKDGSQLMFYDFATKSSRTIYRTSRPVFAGMAVSPDRKRILFTQTDRDASRDLMLVEGFR